jgi:hypothetical protein
MDDDMRRQLETAVGRQKLRKPQWNLSQEILWRLRVSLHDEYEEERRDPAMRGLCFLIGQLAHHIVGPFPSDWRSNLFFYTAFKIAVRQLLDALDPPGPGTWYTSKLKDSRGEAADASMRRYLETFESPEARGACTADLVLSELRDMPRWSHEVREEQRKLMETLGPSFVQSFYGMPDAARDLVPKPQPPASGEETAMEISPIFWGKFETDKSKEPKQ